MPEKISRRDVLAGAAAFAAVAALPAPVARPEFASAYAQFMEAWAAYERAREVAFLARAKNMALVRQTDITALFRAPEVRARMRSRVAAINAAFEVFTPVAANDTEGAMQEEVITICETMLGADDGIRNAYSPSRRLVIA